MVSTHEYDLDRRNDDIFIYIDGDFFHRSEAKISVMDSGFLLGDGVWESMRLHKGTLVHLGQHLDRLFEGAKLIELNIGLTRGDIHQALKDTIQKNGMKTDVHIRLIVSRGIKQTPYQNPNVTIGHPTMVIIPEYKKPIAEIKTNGITLAKVKTIRDNKIQDPRVNSLSKHNCIAACIEANHIGVDEALMLDPHGYVSTCNSTNFFIVTGNEVWTSKPEFCLNGITRASVIRLCKENKIPVYEKNFLIDDVHSSDEVFVTGTFAGIIPVKSVDGIKISDGRIGSITKSLQHWYELDIEQLVNSSF